MSIWSYTALTDREGKKIVFDCALFKLKLYPKEQLKLL